jgi:hypothetical protein
MKVTVRSAKRVLQERGLVLTLTAGQVSSSSSNIDELTPRHNLNEPGLADNARYCVHVGLESLYYLTAPRRRSIAAHSYLPLVIHNACRLYIVF